MGGIAKKKFETISNMIARPEKVTGVF